MTVFRKKKSLLRKLPYVYHICCSLENTNHRYLSSSPALHNIRQSPLNAAIKGTPSMHTQRHSSPTPRITSLSFPKHNSGEESTVDMLHKGRNPGILHGFWPLRKQHLICIRRVGRYSLTIGTYILVIRSVDILFVARD